MTMTRDSSGRVLRVLLLVTVSLAIVGGGAWASRYFMKNRPQPQRQKPPQMAPLVQVVEAHPGAHTIVVPAQGTIIPAVEVTVQARVSGEVIELHPDFREGGIVREGEVLVRLEPRDYELAVAAQEGQLETARYELKAEQGQQDVAQREWELLDMADRASELDQELALRKPQLRQKEAALRAAEAALDMAKLDLQRTTIKAPCNGLILTADVDIGDQATTQTVLAMLVGTDAYWARVSVPVTDLKWIDVPKSDAETGSAVRVTASSDGAVYEGHVLSLVGNLEEEGRMARLLVELPDPLGLHTEAPQRALLLDEYVSAGIVGPTLDDVVAIEEEALQYKEEGTYIWLAGADNTLRIREADIVWASTDSVLLRGLQEGDRIIVSGVAADVDGMAIQVEGEVAPISETPEDVAPAASDSEGKS